MTEKVSDRFEVNQVGVGFIPVGNWYWCRLGLDGLPSEPISAHGPFLLRCLAVRAARRAIAEASPATKGGKP